MHKDKTLKLSITLPFIAVISLVSLYVTESIRDYLLILLFLGLLFLFIIIISPSTDRIPISINFVLLFGFALKALFAYRAYSTVVSPFPDSFDYLYKLDYLLLSGNISFKTVEYISGTSQFFYFYLMYFTVKIFGSTFALYLINILLFCVSAILFYKIIKQEFSKKIAYIATIIALLSTNFIIFTGYILKDSLVLFLTVLIIYFYKKPRTKKVVILLCALIVCLIMTRIYTGFAVIGAIVYDMLLIKKSKKQRQLQLVIALFTLLLSFLAFRYTFLSYYVELGQKFINNYSFNEILTSIPKGLVHMFFAPYPWGVFSLEHSIYSALLFDSFIAMIFSFSLALFLYKLIKYKPLRNKMHLYLFTIFFHALTLGLAYDGGALRQRIAVYLFIILIFVIGIFYKHDDQSA